MPALCAATEQGCETAGFAQTAATPGAAALTLAPSRAASRNKFLRPQRPLTLQPRFEPQPARALERTLGCRERAAATAALPHAQSNPKDCSGQLALAQTCILRRRAPQAQRSLARRCVPHTRTCPTTRYDGEERERTLTRTTFLSRGNTIHHVSRVRKIIPTSACSKTLSSVCGARQCKDKRSQKHASTNHARLVAVVETQKRGFT